MYKKDPVKMIAACRRINYEFFLVKSVKCPSDASKYDFVEIERRHLSKNCKIKIYFKKQDKYSVFDKFSVKSYIPEV